MSSAVGELTIRTGWLLAGLVAVALIFSARALLVLALLFHLAVLAGLTALAFRRLSPTTTTEDELARMVSEQEARIITLQRSVEELRTHQAPPPRPRGRPARDDDITIPGHRPAY